VLDRVLLAKACEFALRAWVFARLVRLWVLLALACTAAEFARGDAAELDIRGALYAREPLEK
jgi:hypothetical protein